MNTQEKIKEDLKNAMREKNEGVVSVLRMLISSFRNKEISIRQGGQAELSDEQVLEVMQSEVKKRKDSIEAYEAGGRQDLADQEKKEIEILRKYLPAQLSAEDLEKVAKEVISEMGEITAKDFGRAIGQVMARVKGQADGGQVSAVVKKILA